MRTRLEIIGGIVLLAVAILALKQWNDKQVEVRVATVIAQHDRDADAKLDARLKQMADADKQRQQDYDAKSAALPKLTPQQIVVKLPEYVPQAQSPVTILKPTDSAVTSGQAKAGDAVVPQADIQPIAKALLDGNKCVGDLASCSARNDAWQEKYKVKSDESDHWQQAAKGGSIWKRVGRDVVKIGLGVGLGAAVVCGSGHCK